MRLRNFLLVYSSRSIRAMIKKAIFADLDDVEIVESDTGLDALCQLSTKAFDLVICSCSLTDLPILKFRRHVSESTTLNRNTEFVVLMEPDVDEASLVEASFEHIVNMPFKPGKLTHTINQACDPRKWRRMERFHIPDSKVTIEVGKLKVIADLINISRGGVLVEVACDRSEMLLQHNPKMTPKLTLPNLSCHLDALPVKLMRFYTFEWDDHFKPTRMRIAFVFTELSSKDAAALDHILQHAEADGLYADENHGEPDRVV